MFMFVDEDEAVVLRFTSSMLQLVNSLIGNILHHTAVIAMAAAIALATTFSPLALIVFIFDKSSIVHRSWLLNFRCLRLRKDEDVLV